MLQDPMQKSVPRVFWTGLVILVGEFVLCLSSRFSNPQLAQHRNGLSPLKLLSPVTPRYDDPR